MAFLKTLPVRPVLSRPVYGGREKREIPEFPKRTETGKTGKHSTPPRCRWCAHFARPGRALGYCASADRPDLLPAYGEHHPLRRLPADQGESCAGFRLHPALGP
ncbi:hypothetical protein Tharo_2887 [Thauera aromatica K172]|uniref:Uncharacterized protein n=1 Tax=Thauera aromatica K172 TaxID=44139 RepID=A0A2R4BR03_THAAR|nr:hypothetical protein Tharo_2887 [Thauera aromatica K172]